MKFIFCIFFLLNIWEYYSTNKLIWCFKTYWSAIQYMFSKWKKVRGFCILSTVVNIQNVRLFWDPIIAVPLDSLITTCSTLESPVHFSIWTIIHCLIVIVQYWCWDQLPIPWNKIVSLPIQESLCVDEQICATKVCHHIK